MYDASKFGSSIQISFGTKVSVKGIDASVPGIVVSGVDANGYVHVAWENSDCFGRPGAPDVEAVKVWDLSLFGAAGE